jgi:hypothetical protein
MRSFLIILCLAIVVLPAAGSAADMPSMPPSFGSDPVIKMIDGPKTWGPDNMYERVNGEAELFKRYGALGLSYSAYGEESGPYLSVDLLHLGVPLNAFGLYRLYAGCDSEEYGVSNAVVLSGDYTSYAVLGSYFMKIDFETDGSIGSGKVLVDGFLEKLSMVLPGQAPLPVPVEKLKSIARKACEVNYHPEHIDHDLESGPGYTWVSSAGGDYSVMFFPVPDEARISAEALSKKGLPGVLYKNNVVMWPGTASEESETYMKKVLKEAVKW